MNRSWDDHIPFIDNDQFNNSVMAESTHLLLKYNPKKNGAIAVIAPKDIYEK